MGPVADAYRAWVEPGDEQPWTKEQAARGG